MAIADNEIKKLFDVQIIETVFDLIKRELPQQNDSIDLLFKLLNPPDHLPGFVQVLMRLAFISEQAQKVFKHHKFNREVIKISQLADDILSTDILSELIAEYPVLDSNAYNTSVAEIKQQKKNNAYILSEDDVKKYIKKKFHGFLESNSVYAFFYYPFNLNAQEQSEEFNHFYRQHILLCSIVFDVYVSFEKKPKMARNFYSVSKSLRQIEWVEGRKIYSFECEDLRCIYKSLSDNEEKNYIEQKKCIASYLNHQLKSQEKKEVKRHFSSTKKYTTQNTMFSRGWGVARDVYIEGEYDGDLEEISFIENLQKLIDEDDAETEKWGIDQREKTLFEATALSGTPFLKYRQNYNQHLFDLLSETEIQALIGICSTVKSINEVRAALYLLITIITGVDVRKTSEIKIIKTIEEANNKTEHYVLFTPYKIFLLFPALTARYIDNDKLNSSIYERSEEFVSYLVKTPLHGVMNNVLKKLQELKLKNTKAYNHDVVLKALNKLIKKASLDKSSSLVALQRHRYRQSLDASDGDYWKAALLCSKDGGPCDTLKHYSTLSKANFVNSQAEFQKPLLDTYIEAKKPPPAKKAFIGNPFLIKKNKIKNVSKWAKEEIKKMKRDVALTNEVSSFVQLFNVFTFYTELMLSYSTGLRVTKNLYPESELLSQNGFLFVNEKDRNNGYHARIVYVSKIAREQLNEYQSFLKTMLNHYKENNLGDAELLKNINKEAFYWMTINKQNKLKIQSYKRLASYQQLKTTNKTVREIFKGLIDNENRHYLRSTLLNKNFPSEYTDAYMGHWRDGTEPWCSMGLFNWKKYKSQIKYMIEKIHGELEFELVSGEVSWNQ